MVSLMDLWLPILLSAVAVFIVSSIIHMALGYHANDFAKLPNEEAALAAMRGWNLTPGDYGAPKAASMKDMGTPEFQAKMQQGPVVMMTVMPGSTGMGKQLTLWFVFSLVVSFFCAYLACVTLPAGATYLEVFQVVGAAGFMGYGLGQLPETIWFGKSWVTTGKNLFDALIYGLVTAGVFGWRWPGM